MGLGIVQLSEEFNPNPNPNPCAAAIIEGNSIKARMLTKSGRGKDIVLKPGSHAFVVVLGDSYIPLMAYDAFGSACGHPQLGCESPVMFAGKPVLRRGELLRLLVTSL